MRKQAIIKIMLFWSLNVCYKTICKGNQPNSVFTRSNCILPAFLKEEGCFQSIEGCNPKFSRAINFAFFGKKWWTGKILYAKIMVMPTTLHAALVYNVLEMFIPK